MDERLQFVGRRVAGEPMAQLAESSASPVRPVTRSSSATKSAEFRG